jgi:DNA-binding transcriptional MocR family regulator
MVRATFDDARAAGSINFGIGQPSPDLMPVELFSRLSSGFMESAEPLDFNYGAKQGDPRFLESLALFLARHYGQPAEPGSLLLTAGNSQALELVCERFTQPGDTVFVEEPSYFLAFQIFLDHGLEIVPIPMDEDGMRMDALEAALRLHRPALVYTIPSFNNPSGVTLSGPRRERLVELSREHGFVIAADEVYQMLVYEGEVPPALGTLIDRGNVVSMGTFSKILAPGLRLGWIQAGPPQMQQLLESGWINSGGSINHFSSHVARYAIDSGLQEDHLAKAVATYRERVEVMHEALERDWSGRARWIKPKGGYFFWLELDEGVDTTALRRAAIEAGTGFQPGSVFSATGDLGHCLRLSFAHYTPAEIRAGMARLNSVF